MLRDALASLRRLSPDPAPESGVRRAWRSAAKRLHFTSVEEASATADPPWFTAVSGQLRVRLEKLRIDVREATRIKVSGLSHGEDGLAVRREESANPLAVLLPTKDVVLGEPNFDREFHVEGQESLRHCWSPAKTRAT